jgi:hypothetical protein
MAMNAESEEDDCQKAAASVIDHRSGNLAHSAHAAHGKNLGPKLRKRAKQH